MSFQNPDIWLITHHPSSEDPDSRPWHALIWGVGHEWHGVLPQKSSLWRSHHEPCAPCTWHDLKMTKKIQRFNLFVSPSGTPICIGVFGLRIEQNNKAKKLVMLFSQFKTSAPGRGSKIRTLCLESALPLNPWETRKRTMNQWRWMCFLVKQKWLQCSWGSAATGEVGAISGEVCAIKLADSAPSESWWMMRWLSDFWRHGLACISPKKTWGPSKFADIGDRPIPLAGTMTPLLQIYVLYIYNYIYVFISEWL